MNPTITILGGGAFGSAMAQLLARKGENARVWERENAIEPYIAGADFVIFAVPAQAFRAVLRAAAPHLAPRAILINLAKGVEEGSLLRLSEVAREIAPTARYVALSGPSHAEEILMNMPTNVCVASTDREAMLAAQELLFCERFRVYTNDDLVGVELGGAIKNVLAVAVGIADGLGFGDNTRAALMTRGLAEMCRLGNAMGAKSETFLGLSGVGDLIVTCGSIHSRNYRCGQMLGRGVPLDEALKSVGQTVEGVPSCKALFHLAKKYACDMPISGFLYHFLHGDITAAEGAKLLLARDKKDEF